MGAKMGALSSAPLRPPSPWIFFLKPAYSLLFGRSDTSALRACQAVFLPPLTPRISGFLFEKSPCFRFRNNFFGSNTNCLVLRRDLKPAALCEFEAVGRKASTARAGPGKISVRKFMQGESLPLRIFLPKTRLSVVRLVLYCFNWIKKACYRIFIAGVCMDGSFQ